MALEALSAREAVGAPGGARVRPLLQFCHSVQSPALMQARGFKSRAGGKGEPATAFSRGRKEAGKAGSGANNAEVNELLSHLNISPSEKEKVGQ